jgi:hypothetical protein
MVFLWWFRRDPLVTRPMTDAILKGPQGLPYLAPELVLLFKAKALRDKDQADWEAARGSLGPDRTESLKQAIILTYGPRHPWAI